MELSKLGVFPILCDAAILIFFLFHDREFIKAILRVPWKWNQDFCVKKNLKSWTHVHSKREWQFIYWALLLHHVIVSQKWEIQIMHFEMAIFQVLAKINVFQNYFSPIVLLRSFKFFFLNLMLASLNYKLHLYFKSYYAKSTTTSDLMSLNMASTFRNNELALFVFATYYFANL